MKKIGIVGHVNDNMIGITVPYISFFSAFGEVSIISPFEKHTRDLDLLVLPGGPDVDPLRYLDENDDYHFYTGRPCMYRERFDKVLLPKYIENNTPIFGICRGHQSMYVQMKGKLIQDMSHETNPHDDRNKLVHSIKFENTNHINYLKPFYNDLKKNYTYKVNSIHHQAVDGKTLPDNCTVLARHKEDNIIEAVTYFPDYPCHSTQWHPEQIRDDFSISLIEHLLSLSNEK